jgi:hypothetical protein
MTTRLRDSGDPAERELLGAEPLLPPGLQDRVRQSIERRLDEEDRPLRWTRPRLRLRPSHLVLAVLLGGSAVAVGASGLRTWLRPAAPQALPVADPAPATPAARPSSRPRRKVAPAPPRRAAVTPPAAGEGEGASGAVGPASALPPSLPSPRSADRGGTPTPAITPAADLLRIARQDRRAIALEVAGRRIEGFARGLDLRLEVGDRELTGTIGEASVRLWRRPRGAGDELIEGTIDGRQTELSLRTTDRGQLLQGSIPGHTVRLELGADELTFFPGCDGKLRAAGPAAFVGTCEGRKIRVELPPAFSRLPSAHQLVVLALLLTETDPVFRYATPRLFPAE